MSFFIARYAERGDSRMELFRILGTIALNNEDANDALDETVGKAGNFKTKLVGTLGSAAKEVAKAAVAATTAAATAVAAITKSAVEQYAEYEQLVGGVDTLFKESSQKVQKYAADAYKTAGLTANNYMSTVTSFSASLLQGLGGDTEQAAELANQAIIDMADNANKMGSDMEAIQAAYQGFAKQNYTLLDNLKLGYGGTATEMARLINDSGVLGDAMIDLADKQNIGAALSEVGFAKMIEAIHVVQTEMGITGTTALEASSTIQGSIAAMKSAWGNLLVGLADGNQDIDLLVQQLGDSIMTTADNLIPRIQTTLESIATLIKTVVPPIVEKLPAIVIAVLPDLLSAALQIVWTLLETIMNEVINGIQNIWSVASRKISEAWTSFWTNIKNECLKIIDSIKSGINSRIESTKTIVKNGFNLIKSYIVDPIQSAYDTVVGIVDRIKSAVSSAIAAVKSLFDTESSVSANTTVSTPTGKTVNVSKHAAGGILTKPTIFGYTPSTGTYHLGGEAGAEAIAPIDVLQGYVRSAVADGMKSTGNDKVTGLLEQMVELLQISATNNTTIEINGREFGRMVKEYA